MEINPILMVIMLKAQSNCDIKFRITEGVRTIERQKTLVAAGKSWTLNSRHLTGDAVDVVAVIKGKVSWEWRYYEKIAQCVLEVADGQVTWGGTWEVRDGVHFEVKR